MTPKKCMSMAKSLTNTQHMELEPLCSAPLIYSLWLAAARLGEKVGHFGAFYIHF